MPFMSTMISPVRSAKEQVESQAGDLAPLDIARYLPRNELAKLGYLYDNASAADKITILFNAAKPVMIAAMVNEYRLDPVETEEFVESVLASEEAHPSKAFDAETIDHVREYLQFAYKRVRIECFGDCMEIYNQAHALYVPVDKIDYLPLREILDYRKNPDKEISREYAEMLFNRDPMQLFINMYARSVLQLYELIPLPEQREMMKPMFYQLWKQIILNPGERDKVEVDAPAAPGMVKSMKTGLKGKAI